ncbi:MAG: dipeptidyl carboxypeptidase II [Gammaproteobacteria bacterium]|nr:MAG: dipeptidyl carboxypeptidase II [Gammaproteobacteria bacterium]
MSKKTYALAALTAAGLLLSACTQTSDKAGDAAMKVSDKTAMAAALANNPFVRKSPLPFSYPEFDKIKNSDFAPALAQGMKQQLAEIDAIANNPAAPTFENTLVAMEKSGQMLTRAATVFFALAGANTNDEIEAVRADVAPKMAAHTDAILLNEKLFQRVKAVKKQLPKLNLDPESVRLVNETYKNFVRAGANLSTKDKAKLREINAELAKLDTQFSQNVKHEVNNSAIVVDSASELDGFSKGQIAAAKAAAKTRGLKGKYVIPLINTSQQPALASLKNRKLRQRILNVSLARGSQGGDYDNRAVVSKVMKLRAERAQLLGYKNHAEYQLEAQTAGSTEAVNKRLYSLAPAAARNARKEAADLQKMIDAEGGDFKLQAWDWDYYADKVRAERYSFDASQLKPYLELNNVLNNGVFYAAEKLYGITFKPTKDFPVYHPDARVWEVVDADGSTLAYFIGDFYARESKRGGAWMLAYVPQNGLLNGKPVIANHLNVPKPPEGEPTLLTWDEVNTLFHEFGHALHGMFSDVQYPSFAGTSVPRDFVEYPSQVNEMWMDWPEVLENYAVHYQTGKPMPRELLDKIIASAQFNQGYASTEYLASSIIDQAWHQLTPEQVPDADGVLAFEKKALEDAGLDLEEVPPRYRTTYFSHSLGSYSAGYYSYIWSEVLDADTVKWFKENGGLTRKNGDHFRNTLLSRGGSKDAMSLFRDFKGSDPDIEPLLERRGLTMD